jgi:hypothetical protein
MEQLCSHWKDFHEIWYVIIFRILVEKFKLSLKCDESSGYFTWNTIHVAEFFLEWEMFHTVFVEKNQNACLIFSNLFPKIVSFMSWHGKMWYSRTGHKWQYGACMLHGGWIRLQTHAQNMLYLLFFHGNKCYVNPPHCFVCMYIACLVVYNNVCIYIYIQCIQYH